MNPGLIELLVWVEPHASARGGLGSCTCKGPYIFHPCVKKRHSGRECNQLRRIDRWRDPQIMIATMPPDVSNTIHGSSDTHLRRSKRTNWLCLFTALGTKTCGHAS